MAIVGVVLAAGYMLWMLERVFFGPVKERYNGVPDANAIEMVCIFTFVAAIMVIGVYPAVLTDMIANGVVPIINRLGF